MCDVINALDSKPAKRKPVRMKDFIKHLLHLPFLKPVQHFHKPFDDTKHTRTSLINTFLPICARNPFRDVAPSAIFNWTFPPLCFFFYCHVHQLADALRPVTRTGHGRAPARHLASSLINTFLNESIWNHFFEETQNNFNKPKYQKYDISYKIM